MADLPTAQLEPAAVPPTVVGLDRRRGHQLVRLRREHVLVAVQDHAEERGEILHRAGLGAVPGARLEPRRGHPGIVAPRRAVVEEPLVGDGEARPALVRDLRVGGGEPERVQDARPEDLRVPRPGHLLDDEAEGAVADVGVEVAAPWRKADLGLAQGPDVEARVRAQVGAHHQPARMREHVTDRDRRVLGAHLEPRQIARQGRVEVDQALRAQLHDQDGREDLADGAELEGRLPAHRNAGVEVRQPELLGCRRASRGR